MPAFELVVSPVASLSAVVKDVFISYKGKSKEENPLQGLLPSAFFNFVHEQMGRVATEQRTWRPRHESTTTLMSLRKKRRPPGAVTEMQ